MESKHVSPAIFVLGFVLIHSAVVASLASATIYNGGQDKPSSVVVVGSVFCDACLEHKPSDATYFISGASVAVECNINRKTITVSIQAETDENGEFTVELPSIFNSGDQLDKCSVRVLSSPVGSCNIPSSTFKSSKLTLTSNLNGVRTYNAGSFSYRMQNVPRMCYNREEDHVLRMNIIRGRAALEEESSKETEEAPETPSFPNLPPLPKLNFPPLPQLDVPSLPKPSVPVPPIPQIPNIPQIPQIPKSQIPPIPQIPQIPQIPKFQFPPIQFLTPPPPAPTKESTTPSKDASP
eukprot:Gb_23891 [translate_table: standard]